ncbi:ROK family transcriptional regulator [Deinococcus misasensis]|uniref:ROK family transcriptional regulator n=1 Tax=Deinococcus misasensis TaxID=392413 RepID=UPI000556F254|nr:ROK family transcriptional regulator [Deinococcus misasensis]
MLSGTNLEYARSHNRRVVLEAIRLHAPISRADIARKTGLTLQAVSNIVTELMEMGIVQALGKKLGGRGQPPLELQLKPDGAFSIGLHLDRDHVMGLIMDLSRNVKGKIIYDLNFPTPDRAIPLFLHMIEQLSETSGIDKSRIWGVGVALPGPLETHTGKLLSPPNFPGWDGFSFRESLEKHTPYPIFIENDSTSAAIGERWYGVGRHTRDYFYLYFGVGLGGGMVLNGEIYHGAWGNTAEIGHIPVVKDGRPCTCGGQGCLERYVSLAAFFEDMEREGIHLSKIEEVLPLFEAGHPAVHKWVDQAVDYLCMALITIENLLNPDVICMGGRLPDPMVDHLLERLKKRLPHLGMQGMARHARLERAELSWEAACFGAASLPFVEGAAPSTEVLMKKVRE